MPFIIKFPDGAFNESNDTTGANGFPVARAEATVYPTWEAAEEKAVDLRYPDGSGAEIQEVGATLDKPFTEDHVRRLQLWLNQAWSVDTTSDASNWTPSNPAWGQCAVTACIVQDQLGGVIVWTEAELSDGRRISHYFNRIAGQDLDLTKEQFPAGTRLGKGSARSKAYGSTREYVLSFEPTRRRYELLQMQVSRLQAVANPKFAQQATTEDLQLRLARAVSAIEELHRGLAAAVRFVPQEQAADFDYAGALKAGADVLRDEQR